MSRFPDPADEREWQPATSQPGEVNTYEGQVRSVGAFARGMVKHDVRLRSYRRSMWRATLVVIGIGVVAVAIIVLSASFLG